MSFAKEVKKEILEHDIQDSQEVLAFMSSLFHACGNLNRNSGGLSAELVTDSRDLFSFVDKLTKRLYGENLKLGLSDDHIINKTIYYRISFPTSISLNILTDCGVLERNREGVEINQKPDSNLLCDDNTKIAYLKGAFIGCGTSSIKLSQLGSKMPTTGYHVEFPSKHREFLESVQEILMHFNIIAKIAMRKNIYVLYIKDSESIKDLLALLGAVSSVFDLTNEMATRELRNTINRQINCINANISKTVEASLKQVEAINLINKKIGLDSLPDDLQEVAVLRLANQQESLDELLKLSTLKLTKSGLNHRFRRILKIAQILKGE